MMRLLQMRMRLLLSSLAGLLDSITISHYWIECEKLVDRKDGRLLRMRTVMRYRRWHPSFWLGVIRCQLLGDPCGSAVYHFKHEPIIASRWMPMEEKGRGLS
jgi:hypothetical protein